MFSIKNILGHAATTIGGGTLGLLQAAIGSAFAAYTQSGNVTDWKPYAVAAATGAATFVAAGLYAPAPAPAVPLEASAPPVPDQHAEIMAKIDAALKQAAQAAVVAEAQKLLGPPANN